MRMVMRARDSCPPSAAAYRSARPTGGCRRIELVRGVWGGALLLAPRAVLGALKVRVDHRAVLVARILGARHLMQAAVSGRRPPPSVLTLGVWVDSIHAATAVGLAATDRDRLRAGLADALVASVWAGAGYLDLAQSRRQENS